MILCLTLASISPKNLPIRNFVYYGPRGPRDSRYHYSDRFSFAVETHKFVFETLTFYAMSEFRKGLPTVENDFSDSENEEYFDLPNDGDHKKRKRRQIKPPKKLSEYETEGSMDNTDDELCMYALSVYCFENLY